MLLVLSHVLNTFWEIQFNDRSLRIARFQQYVRDVLHSLGSCALVLTETNESSSTRMSPRAKQIHHQFVPRASFHARVDVYAVQPIGRSSKRLSFQLGCLRTADVQPRKRSQVSGRMSRNDNRLKYENGWGLRTGVSRCLVRCCFNTSDK